jgi:hypothetical protein
MREQTIIRVSYSWDEDLEGDGLDPVVEKNETFMLGIDYHKYPDPDVIKWCRFNFEPEELDDIEGISDCATVYDNKPIPHDAMIIIISHGMGDYYTYNEQWKNNNG